VSDFDEMMRAGVISPGSTPFVESKKGQVVPEPATRRVVVDDRKTSVEAVEQRTPARTPTGGRNVLLLGLDAGQTRWVNPALPNGYTAIETGDTDAIHATEDLGLIVVDARRRDLARMLETRVPVVVLATGTNAYEARTLLAELPGSVIERPVSAIVFHEAIRKALGTD
jgi:hypothetical protein